MAASVMTQVIMFIAALSITTGLIIALKSTADETEYAMGLQKDRQTKVIQTSIHIDLVHFDNETNTTHVYVRNTGQSQMRPSDVMFFIDGALEIGNKTNITVVADTDTVNIDVWDPKELLYIVVKEDLEPSETHEVSVVTPYTVSDSETFSI